MALSARSVTRSAACRTRSRATVRVQVIETFRNWSLVYSRMQHSDFVSLQAGAEQSLPLVAMTWP